MKVEYLELTAKYYRDVERFLKEVDVDGDFTLHLGHVHLGHVMETVGPTIRLYIYFEGKLVAKGRVHQYSDGWHRDYFAMCDDLEERDKRSGSTREFDKAYVALVQIAIDACRRAHPRDPEE